MKLNFEAVAERVTLDEIIRQIIEEVSDNFKIGGQKKKDSVDGSKDVTVENKKNEVEVTEVKKKSFFGRK